MNMDDLLSHGNCTVILDDERKESARSVFTESFLFTARSPAIAYRYHTCKGLSLHSDQDDALYSRTVTYLITFRSRACSIIIRLF